MKIIIKRVFIVLAVVLVFSIMCTGCVDTTEDWHVPTSYMGYCDQSALFSFSFPKNWVQIETNKWTPRDVYISDIENSLPVSQECVVYEAGPKASDNLQGVKIYLVPITSNITDLNQIATYAIKSSIMGDLSGYHELSRGETVIDGEDNVLVDAQAYSSTEKSYVRFLARVKESASGKSAWVVCCEARDQNFTVLTDDFEIIVRHFQSGE